MNKDHRLVRGFLAGDRVPVPIDTNPLAIDLGARIESLDEVSGSARLSFAPGERFLQGGGVIQGGIVAAMLDFGLAFALFARLPEDRMGSTASLTVDLLKPVRPGHHQVRARLTRLGGRLAFANAELGPEGGEPLATASAVMVVSAR